MDKLSQESSALRGKLDKAAKYDDFCKDWLKTLKEQTQAEELIERLKKERDEAKATLEDIQAQMKKLQNTTAEEKHRLELALQENAGMLKSYQEDLDKAKKYKKLCEQQQNSEAMQEQTLRQIEWLKGKQKTINAQLQVVQTQIKNYKIKQRQEIGLCYLCKK